MASSKCVFNNSWLVRPEYSDWLQSHVSDVRMAKCLICCKSFSIASMGESALKSHMKSKKHREMLELRKSRPVFQEIMDKSGAAARTNLDRPKSTTLDSCVVTSDVLDAEILWTLKTIKNHASYKSNENIEKIFRRMFPDSAIANKFTCGEKKTSYYAVFGIAPYIKDCILETIAQNNFVLLFDESLNQMQQKKQMDVYVRLWNDNKVKSLFLNSVFLGHSTAENMVAAIIDAISPLQISKAVQLSMDGPNVNWKLYRMLQDFSMNEYGKKMLNVGSCGLHTVHNAFKDGCKASQWEISDFFSSLYYLFKDSPARRDDFLQITGSTTFPLKFVQHRWLENIPVAERAITILPNVINYVAAVNKGKVTKPTCKSFVTVRNHVKDKLLPAKMKIFLSVAKILSPFLTRYQTDRPMIVFLAADLKKVLVQLLHRFMLPEKMSSANSTEELLLLMQEKENESPVEKVDLGFAAEQALRSSHLLKQISPKETFDIRIECKNFLRATAKKLVDKSPIQYSFVRNLSCLDPRNMASDKHGCNQKMKDVLASLLEAQQLSDNHCERALEEFNTFLDDISQQQSLFSEFTDGMHLDEFFLETVQCPKKYPKLWSVIEILLLLSHGQATVERGFSVNKKIEVEHLKDHSYVAQRLICDYVNSVGGNIYDITITKKMRTYVSNARQKYLSYLEEQKKLKLDDSDLKRKATEYEEISKKKRHLEVDIAALLKSADELAEQAEDSGDMTLIAKSNSLRRTAKEKRECLIELSKTLDVKKN